MTVQQNVKVVEEKSTEKNELILSNKMKDYYAKNTRNGIARSRKNFFSQESQIVPRE
jgi:hypothetical protein